MFAQQYWSENLTMYFKMITDLQPISENEAAPVLISNLFQCNKLWWSNYLWLSPLLTKPFSTKPTFLSQTQDQN